MKTIVIVDDFKTNTLILKNTLKGMGYDVLDSNDPTAAVKLFDGREISLMITDYKMPGMNGAELTKAVKQKPKYKNMPVLVLSSETDESMMKAAREAGAYGWLSKPFNIERYIKIVNSILK